MPETIRTPALAIHSSGHRVKDNRCRASTVVLGNIGSGYGTAARPWKHKKAVLQFIPSEIATGMLGNVADNPLSPANVCHGWELP